MNASARKSVALVLIALLVALQTGCVRAVTVTTDPTGARVSLDGLPKGTSPATFDSGMGPFFLPHELKAEMSGYETATKTVYKSDPHWGGLIVSLIFLWPLALFTWNYPDQLHLTLRKR